MGGWTTGRRADVEGVGAGVGRDFRRLCDGWLDGEILREDVVLDEALVHDAGDADVLLPGDLGQVEGGDIPAVDEDSFAFWAGCGPDAVAMIAEGDQHQRREQV